ncbi:hypothetical protein [Streptomyces sp. NPDC006510]|uniref:NACHT domain-containing protein n=1 Tax=Streptomyces sp. NPDC006510 TaxID=3155600 RepID=UPI0033B25984
MNVEEQAQLLQRIAIWLVRGGQSELHRSAALRQLERALPGMERLRGQGTAEEILTHLLNRSGVLQERADDVYQFAHRTFQDFLAAKEFVEGDQLNELLGRAGAQHWYDVILLSAGHCGRREHPVLVNGLLDLRPGPADTVARDEIVVLAALCAQHATWLDETTRDRVRTAVEALFPPLDDGDVRLLARLGPAALAHLPDPARVPTREEARPFIDLINEIGGTEAVPHARRWALAHPDPNYPFRANWDRYPVQEYARQVLATFDLTHHILRVDSREKLAALHHLPTVTDLLITGCFTSAELHAALRDSSWTDLSFRQNPCMTDLSFLADCAGRLTALSLSICPAVHDLGPLAGLHALKMLDLDMSHVPGAALAATASKELHSLRLSHVTAERLTRLARPPRPALTEHRPDGLAGGRLARRLDASAGARPGHRHAGPATARRSPAGTTGVRALPDPGVPDGVRRRAAPSFRQASVSPPRHRHARARRDPPGLPRPEVGDAQPAHACQAHRSVAVAGDARVPGDRHRPRVAHGRRGPRRVPLTAVRQKGLPRTVSHGSGAAPAVIAQALGGVLTRPSTCSGPRRLPPARSGGRRAAPTSPRRGR